MLVLDAAVVRSALTVRTAIDALAEAIGAAAREGGSEPPRLAFRHGAAMRSAVVNVGYVSGHRPAVGFKWATSCTCTASPEPVLRGEWIAPGAHVNAVGGYRPAERELDSTTIVRSAAIVVDSRTSASAEAGDLLLPLAEGVLREPFEPAELGEVLAGLRSGRCAPEDVTVFKSLGLGLQDVATAAAAYGRARELGLGVEVSFP